MIMISLQIVGAPPACINSFKMSCPICFYEYELYGEDYLPTVCVRCGAFLADGEDLLEFREARVEYSGDEDYD